MAVALIIMSGCSSHPLLTKKDDWAFEYNYLEEDMEMAVQSEAAFDTAVAPSSAALGFSTGGAKDIANFRENIKKGYLPLPSDITHEGVFYDYYFDTGQQEACDELFCPSYSYAASEDPFSGELEHYLQVGLNSNLNEADFERKKLNLVVVLDISGSMGSPFDEYYYDGSAEIPLFEQNELEAPSPKSKMELANESVVDLLGHLNAEDRFGMVVFDDSAYLAKPLSVVGETDMESIKNHVLELKEQGGTNMEAGLQKGTELFDGLSEANPNEYENRIIFLTDAMPNQGATSEIGLLGMVDQNADQGIFTSFIGIGVDFNTELVEAISKVRGANYYAVHSAEDFKTRMDDEFEYMVTPLVFDLALNLESEGFEIETVYGSPEADRSTGEIMKVNTLFPSKQKEGETRGGIVILKLKSTGDDQDVTLRTSYKNRSGEVGGDTVTIQLPKESEEQYDNDGIRKGILLARYVNLMKHWTIDARSQNIPDEAIFTEWDEVELTSLPPIVDDSSWERSSLELRVPESYQSRIQDFMSYFESEMEAIGDTELNQEIELMQLLIK